MAIASLIASVVGLLILPWMFVFWVLAIAAVSVFAIAGIVMGVIARRQLQTTPQQGKGLGLAVAGITLGGVTVALTVLGTISAIA